MFPISIHQRASKKAILFRRHPIDQRVAWIIVRRQANEGSSKAGGLDGLLGLFVRGRRIAALVINNLFAGQRTRLLRQGRKECAKTVVILLAPFLERMMMTLRALKPLAEKKLSGIFQLRCHVVDLSRPGHWRIVLDVPRSGQNLPHEAIVWFVFGEALANPIMKRKRSMFMRRLNPLIPQ